MKISLKVAVFVCSMLLLASTASQLTQLYVQAASTGEWPMFRADSSHSGAGTGTPALNSTLYWSFNTGSNAVYSSPAVVAGEVYVGTENGTVYALNAANGEEIWMQNEYAYSAQVSTSPAVVNGTVYLGATSIIAGQAYINIGVVYALTAATGYPIWNFQTGGTTSSPNVADGVVYFGTNNSVIYALNAGSGIPIWNYTTEGSVLSTPAMFNGIVYVGSYDNKVYALNATNGGQCWNFSTGGEVYSSPAVANGEVFIGSNDRNIYALNATTGTKLWNYTAGGYVESSPAVASGIVYVGSDDHNVYALNESNGFKIWNYSTGDVVHSSPAVVGSVVYVGSMDGNVYALSAGSGAKLWNYATSFYVSSSPAVVGGIVYVGSGDGNVYALGAQGIQTKPPVVLYPNTFVINPDGSITPSTNLITQTANTCSLTGDMNQEIWVRKSNVVLDGSGYKDNSLIMVGDESNVTIENWSITSEQDILLSNASDISILNNTLTSGDLPWYEMGAIQVSSSSFVTIAGNTIKNGDFGIMLMTSQNNLIEGNIISGFSTIWQHESGGILLSNSPNNLIYHNNFINNLHEATIDDLSSNSTWDNDHPLGGNYWSDYQSKYPKASEAGSSGSWNTPYEIDQNNKDNYPLVDPVNITAPQPMPSSSLSNSPTLSPTMEPNASPEASPTHPTLPTPTQRTSTPTSTPFISTPNPKSGNSELEIIVIPLTLLVVAVAILVFHRRRLP